MAVCATMEKISKWLEDLGAMRNKTAVVLIYSGKLADAGKSLIAVTFRLRCKYRGHQCGGLEIDN